MDSDVHLSKKANFVQIQFNFQYNRNERVKTGGGLPELKESDEEEELLLAEATPFSKLMPSEGHTIWDSETNGIKVGKLLSFLSPKYRASPSVNDGRLTLDRINGAGLGLRLLSRQI